MTRRRVAITGASKGIGRALAEQLAEEGHAPVGRVVVKRISELL
ncbi:hypothetical protein ACWEO4_43100 [Streptomyces sp. NPDC004393]